MRQHSNERCSLCRFWVRMTACTGEVEKELGRCLRMPPTFDEKRGAVFPETYGGMWCGEYREEDAPPDAIRIEDAINDLHDSIAAVETAVIRN